MPSSTRPSLMDAMSGTRPNSPQRQIAMLIHTLECMKAGLDESEELAGDGSHYGSWPDVDIDLACLTFGFENADQAAYESVRVARQAAKDHYRAGGYLL